MLVPTVAVSLQNLRFASDLPFGYSVGRVLLVPFLGCYSPDLGTRFAAMLTSEQRALVRCRAVYFAGDPESGGHPIGRRSTAPETGFRFRCRSWSSAR